MTKIKRIDGPANSRDGKIDNLGKRRIGRSFYRGDNCNFNPYKLDFKKEDFLEKYLLNGWIPNTSPIINANTRITAFGSCFADNISKHLSKIGYTTSKEKDPDIYVSSIGEGLVNVHSLLSQFKWAFDNIKPSQELWHGYKGEEFGYDESIRVRTREIFLNTDFFIITLGLSEIWYDEVTDEVFWRAIPKENIDLSRHKFRVCSMQETKQCLQEMKNYINLYVPNAKVLFTLSPVPLAATFRPINCLSANSVSKSILRAALDEFLRDNEKDLNKTLFYWPSYEIVLDLFYDSFGKDNRHPKQVIIDFIMNLFEAVYCDSKIDIKDVEKLYQKTKELV